MSSCLQLEWPHWAALIYQFSILLFSCFPIWPQSPQIPPYFTWRVLSSADSHFIPVFLNFIARKRVSLIMVLERTITGVEFPLCAPLASNSVSTTERASGFQLHCQSGPRSLPPVTGGGICAQRQKPGVPFREHVGRSHSESHLFGMFYGNRCSSRCTSITLELTASLLCL